jgi:hypothetical protein
MSKRRRYSREYLEAFLQQVKATMPGWIFSQVHRNASRQAGGRARWRSHEEALELLKREAETDSFKLQSLIFPKEHWSRDEAVDWATSHDYSADKVDETEQSYRIRQREPSEFQDDGIRTICLMPADDGSGCMLSATGGRLKEAQEAEKGDEVNFEELSQKWEKFQTDMVDAINKALHGKPIHEEDDERDEKEEKGNNEEKEAAEWSTALVGNLPDSSFAYISPGGKKDSEGKTTPRSLRHLPYRDASGKPDAAHVRNALARLNQTQIPASAKASAKRKLLAAARALGIQTAEEKQVPIFAATDKQIVYGVVMEPDVTDSQGDRTTAETIERAAHAFMVRSRIVGDSHKAKAAAYPVESYIAPSDIEVAGQKVKAGSWIMGIYVADQKLWQAIKNGEYTGLSIGGRAIRRPNLPEEEPAA